MRSKAQKYPSFAAEIEAIENGGITDALLNRIIKKHKKNAACSRELIARYEALEDGVPIFSREPRFGDSKDAINHKINTDFFSEIVDFKTGYFAGKPIAYSYSDTQESTEDTGDAGDSDDEAKRACDEASKCLTDFVTRSNMYNIDLETTKYASICGYAVRLFYIDTDGNERVMIVPPDNGIILSKTDDITHPEYGVRYYTVTDLDDNETIKAEFYDADNIYYADGSMGNLRIVDVKPNLFDGCPLQGIPNNQEMQGDAEKVLALIDAYDRALSDVNNEVDSFANAYMVFENVDIDEPEIRKAQASGAIQFFSGSANNGKVYFLTKDINDSFIENHLNRIKESIYTTSKTPNMSDEVFGSASGEALKYRLLGLESKCGMFEAKMRSAATYMFELLSKSWAKKQVKVEPLQCVIEPKRNFPINYQDEAQTVQALIAAGLPKAVAYQRLSFVDDVEYVLQLIEAERDNIPSLADNLPGDDDTDGSDKQAE